MWMKIIGGVLLSVVLGVHAQAPADAVSHGGANELLVPQGVIAGGFSAPASPVHGQTPLGPYIKLVRPSAVAANGPDLYVADSAQRLLLRVDTVTQAVTPLGDISPLPGTRLKAGPDGSVYVLRPDRGEITRLTRDGRRIAGFRAKYDVLQPADVVIEPTLNRVWISDAAGGVFAFHPSGRMSEPLIGRGDGFAGEFPGATLLAASRERVTGIDPRCRCIIDFDHEGGIIAQYGENTLTSPSDLAIDAHGRTWVVDRGDNRLKVFAGGQLLASIEPRRLGLIEITAISIDVDRAYISDGPAGRIGVFAVIPPQRRMP
ncbi:MAG: hypothetical protein AzoDbin1_02219 [Azoarcus sp.]|uniref:NHL repeat-containing protein n=2 Tax=Aromatoleum tolulyticum TaxID=34027 RepID=A0A1N6ZM43_9RHOO|nr:hypothetical protein [Azoarcus sp.]SIR27908.1 hypothetical protein SAMN05421829_11266 [Aromatoleum tolulyticum]